MKKEMIQEARQAGWQWVIENALWMDDGAMVYLEDRQGEMWIGDTEGRAATHLWDYQALPTPQQALTFLQSLVADAGRSQGFPLLDYLESITGPRSDEWRQYIDRRAGEIAVTILRLRNFAKLKAGRVAYFVNIQADAMEERLRRVYAANSDCERSACTGCSSSSTAPPCLDCGERTCQDCEGHHICDPE